MYSKNAKRQMLNAECLIPIILGGMISAECTTQKTATYKSAYIFFSPVFI